MPLTAPPVLDATAWQPLAAAHAQRADAFTAGRRERRSRQQKHAIEDFLFEYYPVTPAALRRWHPGVGVALDASAPHAGWRWYGTAGGTVTLDVDTFLADRGDAVRFIHGLLTATLGRPALTGCFGLHEWAMVYRETDEHRHPLPLRLGAAGTDAVVETHKIRCTHFDAYRFFPRRGGAQHAATDAILDDRDGAARLPARRDGRVQVGHQAGPGRAR